jgi:Coenzyme PQQ synthesis protein D (PqqD)
MTQTDGHIGSSARIVRNPDVTYRDLEEGGVLLHLQSGAYHGLNTTGSAIWKLLDGEPTLHTVAAGLRDQLDDPPASLEQDVAGFLEGLRRRDLVRVREA